MMCKFDKENFQVIPIMVRKKKVKIRITTHRTWKEGKLTASSSYSTPTLLFLRHSDILVATTLGLASAMHTTDFESRGGQRG
eukprot:8793029-Ditylum_brightwellii.AAC.1